MAYPLRLRRVASAELAAKVREALGWVRLGHLADRMPHQLSGGQLQRVALARALVANPSVLLLDEPLSNLDATLREELRAEIAALRGRLGTTMLYVTHDQTEALALADRVAVMNHGVIEQLSTPERLYADPSTPFVAAFVGGANVLPGEVSAGRFASGGISFALPPGMQSTDGPATLVARPEDLAVDPDGTALPLTARLFLGHALEYRFLVGNVLVRAVGPALAVKVGDSLGLSLRRAKLFPEGKRA